MVRGAAVPVVVLALMLGVMGLTMPSVSVMAAEVEGHKTQGLVVQVVPVVYREAVGVVLAVGQLQAVLAGDSHSPPLSVHAPPPYSKAVSAHPVVRLLLALAARPLLPAPARPGAVLS